jgi:hypothetical protein
MNGNDVTERERMWRRYNGDDWAAYEALPPAVRRRIQEHAYDAWAVNAAMLWRSFRRQTASSVRAERRLLRYLDECEALERVAFADAFARAYGASLPHQAADVAVLRYGQPPVAGQDGHTGSRRVERQGLTGRRR